MAVRWGSSWDSPWAIPSAQLSILLPRSAPSSPSLGSPSAIRLATRSENATGSPSALPRAMKDFPTGVYLEMHLERSAPLFEIELRVN